VEALSQFPGLSCATGCVRHSTNAGIGVLRGRADKRREATPVVGSILSGGVCALLALHRWGDAFLPPSNAVVPLLAILDLGRLVALLSCT
jgi:hypothetical protein